MRIPATEGIVVLHGVIYQNCIDTRCLLQEPNAVRSHAYKRSVFYRFLQALDRVVAFYFAAPKLGMHVNLKSTILLAMYVQSNSGRIRTRAEGECRRIGAAKIGKEKALA